MTHKTKLFIKRTVNSSRIAGAAILLALLGLSACAPTPTEPEPVEPEQPQEIEEKAKKTAQEEDYKRAAELFDAAADSYTDPDHVSRVLLFAAENWVKVDDIDAATSSIAGVNPNRLEDDIAPRFWLVRANILLSHDQARSAAQQLDFLYGPPEGLEKEYYVLRSRIAEHNNDYIDKAGYLIKLEDFLQEAEERKDNRELIWQSLNELPSQALQEFHARDEILSGWIELVLISRQYQLEPPQLEQAIEDWQEDYPDHPGNREKAQSILSQLEDRYEVPGQLALLLPLSGEFAAAGEAIREGVLAAYYSSDFDHPAVTVYDTAGDPERAVKAYRTAVGDGAQHIIGPLTKEELERLIADIDQFDVPILALNSSDEPSAIPDNMIQFSLSPEREAKQAALQARQRGWEAVVSLTSDNSWGERVSSAFAEAFEEAGGIIAQSANYDPAETDFSNPIREILNLNVSQQRFRQINNLLGTAPQYQPRRRADIDGIFIAAFPEQARLIRPQLEYHHAQNLPVMATSHVYGGAPDPERDRDLDGIIFVDAPWLVGATGAIPQGLTHSEIKNHWQQLMERHSRLIALGIDAYRIVPYLDVMRENPDERLDGLTGQLYLSDANIINRGLVSARFVRGNPVFEMPTREGSTYEEITATESDEKRERGEGS
ncbi:penicillin-binding protein activator [Halorhodospira halochloris]|uniref:penicillin-binding protein activator n=1 Tax=Halorhodospira halochloris TaxID=1052 RepID=UPI000BBACAEB|nr:penicillin-binding protein activator [Halorhodospira halochloris]MBK1651659.1 hypothetical protein [Halorhodospira halochloris]